ncbi:hypothetical protein [Vreelandella boliviensis]|uniref:hypothetical protein n=1 Tax=Vreelandella boliviensis TaxID=223527 RepID=UPI001B8AC266|nr:hypothetical protein [Halomonas boliviensis]MBS3670429.1 hypothetical protein [Halomonas boliviensis]
MNEESKNEFQATKKPFNFSNLGWGRKTYLIIIWLFTIAILWVGANDIIKDPADDVPVAVYVLLLFLFLASACWKHYAISKRRTTHLLIIGLLNLLYLNILDAIFIFLFRSISKKEISPPPPNVT